MVARLRRVRGRPAQASLAGVCTVLPPPPTVLWKEVTVPAPLLRRGAPLSEDGTAAEPRGSSWFPSLSLVYVRLAPGVFIYFMLWAVIQYDSVLLLNRLWRWPSGVPRLALLSHPDTPICGGCCVLFLSTSLPRAQDAPGSSRHFLFLSESQCSSREPSPFRWKWCKRPRSGCRRLTTAGESWPLSAGWGPQDHS